MPAVSYIGKLFNTGTITSNLITVSATSTIAVPAGSVIFIGMRLPGTNTSIVSTTDTVGNTYFNVASALNGVAPVIAGIVTNPIAVGTVITFQFSRANTSLAIAALAFANVDLTNPVGTIATGYQANVIPYTAVSAAPARHGSMLVAMTSVNDGTGPSITTGSLTVIGMTPSAQAWMSFGFRQNADLNPYTITYNPATQANRVWGSVLFEVNRRPSDMISLF